MRDDFCILILSYNRAGNIPTITTLERHGYTGDWYIVIDNEEDIEPYSAEYGDKVIYFDKDDTQPELDRGDNFDHRHAVVYARHQSFDIAKDLGVDYFMVLDDDYTNFERRFNADWEYEPKTLGSIEPFIEEAITYMERADIDAMATAQGGDFIGGKDSGFAQYITAKRKVMNTWICRTDKPFRFFGTINEDVNVYARSQQLGKVFMTPNIVTVNQAETQQQDGGLTEIYLAEGTYVKSFYSILYSPSCVDLIRMGDKHYRIHHRLSWRNAVPKIVAERFKKASA